MSPLAVIALFLGLYALLRLLRSQRFWDWILFTDLRFELFPSSYEQSGRPLVYPPKSTVLTLHEAVVIKSLPKACKNFGPHHNPLSFENDLCNASFEQVDARTWQCPACQLLHFEKSEDPN